MIQTFSQCHNHNRTISLLLLLLLLLQPSSANGSRAHQFLGPLKRDPKAQLEKDEVL
jgi:hypothetical protein